MKWSTSKKNMMLAATWRSLHAVQGPPLNQLSNSDPPDNFWTISYILWSKSVTDKNTAHSLLTVRLLFTFLLSSWDQSLVLLSLSLSLCFFFLWYFFWWSPWCFDEPEISTTFSWLSMKDSSLIKIMSFGALYFMYNMTCNKDKHTEKCCMNRYTNYFKTLPLNPEAWFTSHITLHNSCPNYPCLYDLKFSSSVD